MSALLMIGTLLNAVVDAQSVVQTIYFVAADSLTCPSSQPNAVPLGITQEWTNPPTPCSQQESSHFCCALTSGNQVKYSTCVTNADGLVASAFNGVPYYRVDAYFSVNGNTGTSSCAQGQLHHSFFVPTSSNEFIDYDTTTQFQIITIDSSTVSINYIPNTQTCIGTPSFPSAPWIPNITLSTGTCGDSFDNYGGLMVTLVNVPSAPGPGSNVGLYAGIGLGAAALLLMISVILYYRFGRSTPVGSLASTTNLMQETGKSNEAVNISH